MSSAMSSAKLLIVVHPGSAYGSAQHNIDCKRAQDAQHNILSAMEHHHGPIVVLESALSDEMPRHHRARFQAALETHTSSIRLWAADTGGENPPDWWLNEAEHWACSSYIAGGNGDLNHAPSIIAAMFPEQNAPIVIGAWATKNLSSGCVSFIVTKLRENGVHAILGDSVLYEEEIVNKQHPHQHNRIDEQASAWRRPMTDKIDPDDDAIIKAADWDVREDPDQPGYYLFKTANGEGSDISHETPAEAARTAVSLIVETVLSNKVEVSEETWEQWGLAKKIDLVRKAHEEGFV